MTSMGMAEDIASIHGFTEDETRMNKISFIQRNPSKGRVI